jgi:hypothetical protein
MLDKLDCLGPPAARMLIGWNAAQSPPQADSRRVEVRTGFIVVETVWETHCRHARLRSPSGR